MKIEQKDILDYTSYLMKNLYKKPTKATKGTVAAKGKWLFSKQHIFELGRWDEKTNVEAEEEQTQMRGCVRTAETWDEPSPSWVKIWREKPKITTDNIVEHRVRNDAEYIDAATGLPKQKYHTLFKMSVLKKWDLWKNAQECGFGAFLVSVYPPLSAAENTERTRLINEQIANRGAGAGEFNDEAEE